MNNLNIRKKISNSRRQKGATMWMTLFYILTLGFFGLLAFNLVPIYIEYSNIRASMQEIVNQNNFREMSQKQILSAMSKRMMIDSIRDFKKESFQVARDKSGEKYIIITYSKKAHVAGNVSALVEFNEEIRAEK
ncbi:DUF4845 domain-containing protein [Aliikangiella sp. IMCC44359]|uniref:DUF4845 domain-containing protein n=1 Tax=Aliikangiella sp. IMCC44359 TaxID=3459125 RepID=UPI00403AE264